MKRILTSLALAGAVSSAAVAQQHPLDGITADEYLRINEILKSEGAANDETLFPMIELKEPPKAEVLAWSENGTTPDRKAIVYMTDGEGGFRKAIVDITNGSVETNEVAEGQPMVLFAEFIGAIEGALSHEDMIAGLAARGLTPDQAFCLPLTAGNFFDGTAEQGRFMKVPCYASPEGSNFYAKPLEGLYALYNLSTQEVVDVVDEGVLRVPSDPWGYTEEEVARRQPLREESNPVVMSQEGGPNYSIEGTQVAWDIWRFNYRIDKRSSSSTRRNAGAGGCASRAARTRRSTTTGRLESRRNARSATRVLNPVTRQPVRKPA